ncbi:MAG TPA: hypothetical protein VD931_09115 [Baekduia sp.]|nr:hypothetical protein [Baekduia sp.]
MPERHNLSAADKQLLGQLLRDYEAPPEAPLGCVEVGYSLLANIGFAGDSRQVARAWHNTLVTAARGSAVLDELLGVLLAAGWQAAWRADGQTALLILVPPDGQPLTARTLVATYGAQLRALVRGRARIWLGQDRPQLPGAQATGAADPAEEARGNAALRELAGLLGAPDAQDAVELVERVRQVVAVHGRLPGERALRALGEHELARAVRRAGSVRQLLDAHGLPEQWARRRA